MSTMARPDDNAIGERDGHREPRTWRPTWTPAPPSSAKPPLSVPPRAVACDALTGPSQHAGAPNSKLDDTVQDGDQAGEHDSLLPSKPGNTPDRVDRTEEASSSENPLRLALVETSRCRARSLNCMRHP